ncbi:unnamed protein product [Oikopleura dioica]|uniref:ribonuclease H n=1 Tax=Oikopleura dioica TaxID=34765 RepID=E4X2E3_OIKDI|nr:unnamed protein product [Oikopleura dioica]
MSTPDQLPQIECSINTYQIVALIDSGCNLVLLSFTKSQELGLKLSECRISVKAANGESLRIYGETRVSVLIGTRVFKLEAVVASLNYDLVLPSVIFDTLAIDNSAQTVALDGEVVPLRQRGGAVEINLIQQVNIEPQSSLVVEAICSVENGAAGIIHVSRAESGFLAEYDAEVVESVVNAERRINLMVINRSFFPITIPQKAPLANGHWLEPRNSGFESNELVGIENSPSLQLEAQQAAEIRRKKFNPQSSLIFKEVEVGDWLDQNQKNKLNELLSHERTVFSVNSEDIGCINQWAYRIRWKDESKTCYAKPIKPKFSLRAEGCEQLAKWERMSIIKKQASQNNSPLFFIRKKCGKIRPILDARGINRETLEERWPLPSMDSMLNEISGVISAADKRVFISVTDISSAYSQLLLTEDSRKKVSFSYGPDQYTANRVLFGLRNAPSSFSLLMRNVLRDVKGCYCLIDDIILVHENFDDHFAALKSVFERFNAVGLTLAPQKTHLCVEKFTYLGYEIAISGLRPIKSKIDAIVNYPAPRNKREARRFAGLCVFYSRHLPRLMQTISPIHKICANNSEPFRWSNLHADAFEKAKEILSSAVTLAHVDSKLDLVLVTDASNEGIAGALHQRRSSGHLEPLGFYSRSLADAEKKLASRYKELLAIVGALEFFENIVFGRQVYVISDHQSLKHVLEQKRLKENLPVRVINYFMRLTRFDVACIEHATNDNGCIIALDAISRAFNLSVFNDYDDDESRVCNTVSVKLAPQTKVEAVLNMSRYNLRSKKQAEQQKPVFIIDDVPYTADTVRKCQLNDENTVKLIDNGKLKEHGNGLFYSDKSGIRALIYLPDDLALSVLSYLHLKMHHPGSKCLASVFERHFTARNVQRLTNQESLKNCKLVAIKS